MKQLLIIIAFVQLSTICLGALKHRFVAIDNKKGNIHYVNEFDTDSSWTVKAPAKARSIQLVGKDTILINTKTGAVTYNLSTGKQTGWEISNLKNVICAGKMPNGNYYFGLGTKIIITDKTGKTKKTISLPKERKGLMRLATLTKENTFLYAGNKPFSFMEVDMNGNILADVKLPGKGYQHQRLANGNILSSQGYENSIIETDMNGKIIREFGGDKHLKQYDLDFCSGWTRLKNGNVVMTNWLGHRKDNDKADVHAIEFDKNNDVIWTWNIAEPFGVTNILVIE